MADCIIKRHNDRYKSLFGRTHNDTNPLFTDKTDFIVRYIKNRCVAVNVTHRTLTKREIDHIIESDPNPDDPEHKVDAVLAKFRNVLSDCRRQTRHADVYVNNRIVIKSMKDVQVERTQAKQAMFPTEVVEGLSARQQFLSRDQVSAHLSEFKPSGPDKERPAVCKPVNLTVPPQLPSKSGQNSGSHSADATLPDKGQLSVSHSAEAEPP